MIATAEIYDRMESIVELDVPNYPLAEYKAPENYAATSCPPQRTLHGASGSCDPNPPMTMRNVCWAAASAGNAAPAAAAVSPTANDVV